MTNQTMAAFAAAVYSTDTGDRKALLKFVEKQKALHTRVGGVLQEALFDAQGAVIGLNAVDVETNHRIPITRPAKNGDECSFNVSAHTQTATIISDAIRDRLDLVVVEKFGELEQNGEGLIDEILQTIAEGIPLLISVPEAVLPLWQERSGELGTVLAFTEEAFEQWWQSIATQGETGSPDHSQTNPGS